jgi:hypothetical protein
VAEMALLLVPVVACKQAFYRHKGSVAGP